MIAVMAPYAAHAQAPCSTVPPSVLNADCSLNTSAMPALTGDASGPVTSTVVAVQRPAYSPTLTLVAGTPLALPAGYAIYNVTGSGLLAAGTIRLPPSPQDRQTARVAMQGSLTVTALTIQDASGNAVGTAFALGVPSDALFQFQGSAWVRIGS